MYIILQKWKENKVQQENDILQINEIPNNYYL